MTLTVSQVAKLTGVSIRTLHYYDEVGLLRPSGRSDAGYRLYAPADLEHLQQVLFFRELGFPLAEITRIVGDPEFDIGAALRLQRQLLAEKVVRFGALLKAVDAAIARTERKPSMEKQEVADMFKDFQPQEYAAEAEQRWGDTPAFRESKRRTAGYTERDHAVIKAESSALFAQLAALLVAGTPPSDAAALAVAEAHRQHIERWFYPCPAALHRGLGELYVNDPRFTANIDRQQAGLARYACDAFAANAGR